MESALPLKKAHKIQKLHVDADPLPTDGRPVLALLHGFTQDHRSWGEVREGLRRIGPTVAVDLIGHGRSPKPEEPAHYRMEACLQQLEAALERLGLARAWWVGYSMGGRVAMQLAVHRPERVAGLVLMSSTAGLFGLEERAERIRADEALASRIPGWGVEAFVDYWLEQPLFEGFKRLPPPKQRQLRKQRLDNSVLGLSNALRGLGTGAMPPIWGELRDVNVPALVMAGELDEKFASLARTLASILPEGHLSILPDTGHALHLESPLRFLKAVHGFFERLHKS